MSGQCSRCGQQHECKQKNASCHKQSALTWQQQGMVGYSKHSASVRQPLRAPYIFFGCPILHHSHQSRLGSVLSSITVLDSIAFSLLIDWQEH